MKSYIKYLTFALAGVAMVACNDLDTEPMGGTVTSKQKADVVAANPAMAEAGLEGLPQSLKLYMSNYDVHTDFGVPSLFLITDSRGMDLYSLNIGYNWYSGAAEMGDFAGNYYDNLIFWNTYYKIIKSSNDLLDGTPSGDDVAEEIKFFRSQSYAYRAYAYLNLAQMYQFTYAKDPEARTVPLITDANMVEVGMNGCPRATGTEIYAQILSDIENTINLLEAIPDYNIPSKRFVNLAVAYGLRARTMLFMQNWAGAVEAADKAISLAKAAGLSPYSIAEASQPAFVSLDDHNFMWGIQNLTSEAFTGGVVNFASMMGSWMSNGYCSTGTYRMINNALYEEIPTTDVRKGWWLNGSAAPAASMPAAYKSYIASCVGKANAFLPYTQVKFGAASTGPGTPNGATDVPLMRVEEMYLIKAEAEGMQSPATGAQTLSNFVKTYRDSNYSFSASSSQALQDEVWKQRRLELWGEGFSYFDMMRLQKTLDRRGSGIDPAWVFVVAPDDPVLIYEIVQPEVQTNKLIGDYQNGASVPEPVAD